MATVADTLRELHRLHRHLRDLKAEVEKGPRLLKAQQGKLARAENALHEAQAQLKHLKVSVHEKETSLKFAHQQIAKYEKQRSEAGAKKEYDALQHEIDHCRQTGNVLEDEILTLMAQVEEKSAQVPELEKALAAVKAESAGFDMEARDRIARLTADLQATTANLVEVEKNIPGEVRSLYDRLTAAKGADAISAVQDQTCTACYSTVTAQQGRELEAGIVVLCKNCGRIMYLVK